MVLRVPWIGQITEGRRVTDLSRDQINSRHLTVCAERAVTKRPEIEPTHLPLSKVRVDAWRRAGDQLLEAWQNIKIIRDG